MSISVTCPNCHKNGVVPDAMNGQSIKCRQCQFRFLVRATAPSTSSISALLDEDDSTRAVPTLAVISPRSAVSSAPPSSPHLIYATCAFGIVCVLLLMVVIGQLLAPLSSSKSLEKVAYQNNRGEKPKEQEVPPPPPSPPVPPSPEVSLGWLEDATVFIKLKAGKALACGTGFVIRVQGDTALIATNRHVVSPDFDDEGGTLEITAVFRSGRGPEQEQSLPAEIVAVDSAEEMNHDLALLKVRGLKRPVKPIDINQMATPALRMKYAAYGFPLPNIGFNKDNPTITATGGQVSALRPDDMGQLFMIQLDGSLQPGNSGGPIVDERGRLIGIAVAKLEGVDTIGLAIPADELRELLAGRVGAIDLDVRNSRTAETDVRVRAQVVDPNGGIKSVHVLVAPAQGAARLTRRSDGSWPALPGASPVALRLDRSVATGDVKVALGTTGADARRVLIQTAHVDSTGKLLHSRPRPYDLPDQDGRLVAGRKIEELKRKLARKSLARLGPLVEDDNPKTADECQIAKDQKERTSTISMPAKLFTLSPQVLKQNRPIHNAPRSMVDVEGDFLAYVQVNGNIDPGLDATTDPRGRKLPVVFQGAGLLIYQNKENFVRLERACSAVGASLVRELLVEVVRGGREIDYYYVALPGDPSAPLDLFLIRRKGRVFCMFSHDGRSLLGFREFSLDYPAKVKIGLTASNLSRKPFTAKFANFVLLDDKLKLEAEFGD